MIRGRSGVDHMPPTTNRDQEIQPVHLVLVGNPYLRDIVNIQPKNKISPTFTLWLPHPKVIHSPDPKPSFWIYGPIVTPQPLIVLLTVIKSFQ